MCRKMNELKSNTQHALLSRKFNKLEEITADVASKVQANNLILRNFCK